MPLLTDYNMEECLGFEQAENDWLVALRAAHDSSNVSILVSAERGFDAEINDAILANPQPDMCPLARLNIWQDDETLAMGGGPVFAKMTMQTYLFYYYGVPSTDPLFTELTKLRRRHIAIIQRAIQYIQPGISEGVPQGGRQWKWDTSRTRMVDYSSPFRYLEKSYVVPPGFNCVRLDSPVLIKTAQ